MVNICRFLTILLVLLLSGCTTVKILFVEGVINEPLTPGLQVVYFDGMFRNVRQVPDEDTGFLRNGTHGVPILIIDHQFGEDEVFGSGRSRGVGMRMTGYLLLEEEGLYHFQALSNDGIEVFIDGTTVLLDPGVHPARLSEIGTLTVEETGYHPLIIKYFQRKGTAALRLLWKPPGQEEFTVIPARAYGHKPAEDQ